MTPSSHARAHIGTSGWSYPEWKDTFYAGVPRTDWLRHCARRFTGLEVNATFYRALQERTLIKWRDQTPDDFRFAIKGNRYLTHVKRLNDPEEPIARERSRVEALGERLAVVLWQMPARLEKDLDHLERFARALRVWSEVRHVLEFRHTSWFDEEVAGCLAEHRLASCISDAASWPCWDEVTTDLAYVRLHGHTRTYASGYSPASLDAWADRVRGWLAEGREVHVYFDNTGEGHAPRDALALLERLAHRGRGPC